MTFVMRPRIGAPKDGEIEDTEQSCADCEVRACNPYRYVHSSYGGHHHYPVPAIRYHVDGVLTRSGITIWNETYLDTLTEWAWPVPEYDYP